MKRSALETKLTVDNNSEIAKNRIQEEFEKRILENQKFNDNVLSEKEILFDNIINIDGNIIVRALKYTGETTNNGLLLERKYESYTTQGGKPASKVEDWNWADKGVIVKMPEADYIEQIVSPEIKWRYQALKEGDLVYLNRSVMAGHNTYYETRDFPVIENRGYLSVPVTAIQMKVKA